MCVCVCVCVCQGAMACCRRKERKVVSDEESSEMDADPSTSEEELPVAGPFNITDEMKRMLNTLYVNPAPSGMHQKSTLIHVQALSNPTHGLPHMHI